MNFEQKLESLKQEFQDNLSKLIQIPSVSTGFDETKEFPFGKPVQDALEFMLTLGKQLGFQVENIDNYAGVIEFGEGEEFGLLGHLDVVPVGDGWTNDPFSGKIIDGRMYGRGTIDDKGPTIAALYAMYLLKESGMTFNKRIRLILGTDEESGMNGLKYYLKRIAPPKQAIAPDADFPLIYAEKAILIAHIFGETKIEYLKAGTRANVVPDVAEVKCPEYVKEFTLFCKEKNLLDAEITTKDTFVIYGKSAHAMEPKKGVNALSLMAEFLMQIYPEDKLVQLLNLHDTDGTLMNISYKDEELGAMTMNLGALEVENGSFKLSVNNRYPKGYPYHDTYVETVSNYGKYFEKEFLKDHYVDKDSTFIQTLMKSYQKYSNDTTSKPKAIGGGTYARMIPGAVAYGPLFPGRDEVMHQVDEYVYMEDLYKATLIYADAMYELCK